MNATMPPTKWTEKTQPQAERPERAEVEAAVRTIIRWTGDDPERAGLLDTPRACRARLRGILFRLRPGPGRDPAKDL